MLRSRLVADESGGGREHMPIHYEVQGEIDRPIEDVFDYITDVSHDPEWIGSVSSVKPPESGMAEGVTWTRTVDAPFGSTEIVLECTEFERPTRFSYQAQQGMMGGRLRNALVTELSATNGRTAVTAAPTIEVSGVLRLLSPLVKRMTQSETTDTLQNLQAELEGERS